MDVHYRNADGRNSTPVSDAAPLPVKALAYDSAGNANDATHPIFTQPATGATTTFLPQGVKAATNFTTGTTAYAANDVVGPGGGGNAALTFAFTDRSGSAAAAGEFMITSAALEIDDTAIITGQTSYRLYLYNVTPPSAFADSAVWDLPSGDRASFLGYVDLGTIVDMGSTLYVETNGINKQLTFASGSIFGYLVSNGAYTPLAKNVHTCKLCRPVRRALRGRRTHCGRAACRETSPNSCGRTAAGSHRPSCSGGRTDRLPRHRRFQGTRSGHTPPLPSV
jgi:hypothetical protein